MSLFARLDQAAQATTEAVYGEAFTLRPRKRSLEVNAAWQPDLERIELGVTGIYRDLLASRNIVDAWDQRTDQRPGVTGNRHWIEVDPRTNPGFASRPGDLFFRPADGSTWRVVSIDPDEMGRLHHNVEKGS
jgi:hypothetical protein